MSIIRRFILDTDAATAVEYAVMLALILAAVIAGITSVGGGNANLWQNNSDEITNAMTSSS
jgi:pilus assembly protein Flp/PilA